MADAREDRYRLEQQVLDLVKQRKVAAVALVKRMSAEELKGIISDQGTGNRRKKT